MTWFLTLMLFQAPGAVPPPPAAPPSAKEQAERVRAAMAASLQKQRESVRRQAAAIASTAPAGSMGAVSSEVFIPPPCDPVPKLELTEMVEDAANRQGVDPSLVLEVARQESGFRPCAVSRKGAEGLMQLMPSTQIQFQVSDPFDAKQSIEAGSKLLKDLLERYHGDISLALSAYNAGAGRVDRSLGIPEIPETQNYVVDILSRLIQ